MTGRAALANVLKALERLSDDEAANVLYVAAAIVDPTLEPGGHALGSWSGVEGKLHDREDPARACTGARPHSILAGGPRWRARDAIGEDIESAHPASDSRSTASTGVVATT